MRAALIPAADASPALVAGWRALERTALEPNPYFAPELVQPALRHVAGPDDVHLLLVRDGPDVVFLAPVTMAKAALKLPLPAITGWRHRYSYLGTPLVAPEAPVEAWRAVLRLLAQRRRPAWTVLPSAVPDGPVASALEEAAKAEGAVVRTALAAERAFFRRPDDGRAPDERMSKNTRRRLRRYREQLGVALGGAATAVRGAEQDALERFLTLEASGWKGRCGTALASTQAGAEFFRETCRGFSDSGRLRVFDLCGPEGSAAMMVSIIAGEGVFDFKIGYDEALSECRPGTLLRLDATRAFLQDPSLAWVDSCAEPDNEWANRLYPDRRLLGQLVIAPDGVLGATATRLAPRWNAVGRAAKQRLAQQSYRVRARVSS